MVRYLLPEDHNPARTRKPDKYFAKELENSFQGIVSAKKEKNPIYVSKNTF